MSLKDRMRFLTTPDEVDAFVRDNPAAAIFKAGTCHKTNETFTHVQSNLEGREDLPLGVIRVVENRPASNRVADMTGVRHESPQILLFKDGRHVYDSDNWDITAEDLGEALSTHFPVAVPQR